MAHAVEVAGVEQGDAGIHRAWMVAMLSARSAGPYMPDMPMQPSSDGRDERGRLAQMMLFHDEPPFEMTAL